ncbi:hypothetical protein U1Q18_022943 [Sarracenia purpurea var. burkii]
MGLSRSLSSIKSAQTYPNIATPCNLDATSILPLFRRSRGSSYHKSQKVYVASSARIRPSSKMKARSWISVASSARSRSSSKMKVRSWIWRLSSSWPHLVLESPVLSLSSPISPALKLREGDTSGSNPTSVLDDESTK